MNDENKNRLMRGLKVLALFLLGSLAIGASVGCFNYATLAKAEGNPDNFFWFIGVANLVWNAFVIYTQAKKLKEAYQPKAE